MAVAQSGQGQFVMSTSQQQPGQISTAPFQQQQVQLLMPASQQQPGQISTAPFLQQQVQFAMPTSQTQQVSIQTPQQQIGQMSMVTGQQQQPGQLLMTSQQPGDVVPTSQLQSIFNIRVIHGLGITQIVVGILTVIFGITLIAFNSVYWVNRLSAGIWFGIWITVSGVIALISSFKPQNNILNGTNMGFNITCSVISAANIILYGVALGYFRDCRNWDYAQASRYSYTYSYTYYYNYYTLNKMCDPGEVNFWINVCLLTFMIAEFSISLSISIFCCKGGVCGSCARSCCECYKAPTGGVGGCCKGGVHGSCGGSCCECCKVPTGGQIIYYQQPGGLVTNPSTAPSTMFVTTNIGLPQANYPGTAIPYNNGAQVMYQPSMTHGYTTQDQMIVQQPAVMGTSTSTVYSTEEQHQQQQQPPEYKI